ncbi:MAG: EVE domain-containing protein [Ignisphaera sp.]
MSSYWIVVVSEENWGTIKNLNIYGAPEPKLGKPIYELVKSGDYLIFYVAKKSSKTLGGKFVGVYKVASTWFREEKPLWQDEVKENRVKYPWRVKIEPVKIGIADFSELASKLKFIERKDRANAYLVGTPANMRRPIPEEDARTIIENLR